MSASVLRKAYDAASVVALLNMVLLVGGVAYLVSGGMDADKLARIGAVLRGDEPEAPADDTAGRADVEEEAAAKAEPVALRVVDSRTQLEIIHREAERIKAELRQRLALNNSILLKVTTERERFQREREAALKEDKTLGQKREAAGFQKQLAILQGLSPRLATKHLLAMGDSKQAARVLMSMNTSRAKKIVEAAKRGNDLIKMQQILLQLRKLSPERVNTISSDK